MSSKVRIALCGALILYACTATDNGAPPHRSEEAVPEHMQEGFNGARDDDGTGVDAGDMNDFTVKMSTGDESDMGESLLDQGGDDMPRDLVLARAMHLAHDAYLYGYPAVLMDVTREMFLANDVPENTLVHLRQIPDARFRAVVRPNTDTLYSTAWLDLSEGPVVLTAPAIDPDERFYMFALLDAWTNAFAAPGTRHNNGAASVYAIVAPGQALTLPEGMIPIEAPTNTVWLIGRIEVFGAEDVSEVTSIQDRFGLMTLEDYRAGVETDNKAPDYAKLSGEPTPPELVARMDTEEFFARLTRILETNPPPARDDKQLEQLAEIGLTVGNDFDLQALTPNRIEALEAAPAKARNFIDTTLEVMSETRTWAPGHRIPLGDYDTNYLIRAVVARIGLGANLNEDARYINARIDSRGDRLEGSSRYVIHFDAEALPPVRAFWSLTVYDQDGYLLPGVLTSTVGSNTALHENEDGSIDIWLQQLPPSEPSMRSNWLPIAPGPFELTMRMYWPEEAALDGMWRPPAITPRPER